VIGLKINENTVLGLIPARGGSKSIPIKNIAPLTGRPLISLVIAAAKASVLLDMFLCSTDHSGIAAVCEDYGVQVMFRPPELSRDDTPVSDVVRYVLRTLAERNGEAPGLVALLQPTSPFLLPGHIDDCVAALRRDPDADSAQTVTEVFHNAHAFNQRVIEGSSVRFCFLEERRRAFNKQLKPKHYLFGNLVVSRTRALLSGKDCFGDRSVPIEIPRACALDVDTQDDLDYADYLLKEGKVAFHGSSSDPK
jgi:CMP-N-acetylneuraminic acid synthetase